MGRDAPRVAARRGAAGTHAPCPRAQVPEQLQALFQANYALLLSIFNPEGWLDITYVDDELRVGRDDKGNLYVLQRGAAASNDAQ